MAAEPQEKSSDNSDIFGYFTPGEKYSSIIFYGEDHTMLWYFETRSPVGEKVRANCSKNKMCYLSGRFIEEQNVPAGVENAPDGRWKLVAISFASRKKPLHFNGE